MTFKSVCKMSAVILLAAYLSGCGFLKQEKPYTRSEAETKLIDFLEKEGKVNGATRTVGKSVWIYIPLTDPLFELKASRDRAKSKREPIAMSLLSLDGQYEDLAFAFSYDIVPDVLPSKGTTYGSSYNEQYAKKRQLVYQALQETYFNLSAEDSPDFVVIVIVDITKGVGTKNTVYLKDLKQYMTEALPFEEYFQRELNEVFGNENLIGDTKGRYLEYADVDWTWFLLQQMEGRIRFKFGQSDFPPDSNPETTIISIVANTLRFYPFKDFSEIRLHNRREKKDLSFSKAQLASFEEQSRWEKEKGRLITIRFDPLKGTSALDPVDKTWDGSSLEVPDQE